MKNAATRHAIVIGLSASFAFGDSVTESFEGQTPSDSAIPDGWTFVTTAGDPSFVTTADGEGSDGSGATAGLAGRVSSTDFRVDAVDLPGGVLVNNTSFDVNAPVSGSFDFYIPQEGTFDDMIFAFGEIADGFSQVEGEALLVKLAEAGSGGLINTGTGLDAGRIASAGGPLVDDTWYRATISWTPTGANTGDFSITVSNFSNDLFTVSTAGYVFNALGAQIGFGSVNDTVVFDNVDFTGSLIDSNPDDFALSISEAAGPAGGFDLEWTSRDGRLYRIRKSASLDTAPSTWEIVAEGIASAGDTTDFTITPDEASLFYVVEEYASP